MMRLSWNISESQSAPRHLAISLQPALTGADPVCCREYLGWWTELCSTDPSQIAHFSNVIFVNSVTWALGVAILGRQAAVLLISYFTVFTPSNWPPVYLCVGSSPFSSRMPSIWNERSGIVPGKSSVADGEKTIYTHTAVQYYFMKNEILKFMNENLWASAWKSVHTKTCSVGCARTSVNCLIFIIVPENTTLSWAVPIEKKKPKKHTLYCCTCTHVDHSYLAHPADQCSVRKMSREIKRLFLYKTSCHSSWKKPKTK